MSEPLTDDQAAAIAGGPVLNVEMAREVPEVTDADVRRAEAEAADLSAKADTLERSALIDPAADLAKVATVREQSRFAMLRTALLARQAERSRQAARLLALAEIGTDIDALVSEASAPDRKIAKAARDLARAASTLRQLAGEHDNRVRELVGRAKGLGVEPAAPSGPRATSAHVAAGTNGASVQHGRIRVSVMGPEAVTKAIAQAAAGDPDGATALLTAVHEQPPVHRQDGYFASRSGHVFGMDGPVGDAIRAQIASGELRQLTAREVDAYLDGRFHGFTE